MLTNTNREDRKAVLAALNCIQSIGGLSIMPDTPEWLEVRDMIKEARNPWFPDWRTLGYLIDEALWADGMPALVYIPATAEGDSNYA